MSAFKIFSRFAELLDINVTRAAVAWLRLNADGTVTERTAAETLSDLGGISGIDNTAVNTAISTNNSATRSALGLGAAALSNQSVSTTSNVTFNRLYINAGNGSTMLAITPANSSHVGIAINSPGGTTTPLQSWANLTFVYADGRLNCGADIECTAVSKGLIVKSPDGNRWRLTPDNSGNSVWTAL